MADYFFDPVLRAPLWGCLFMCLAASLMGVLIFLQKRTLLGETLSHAAFPGIVCSLAFYALFDFWQGALSLLFAIAGAALFAIAGLRAIDCLVKRKKAPADAAQCFVLSSFFGLGILFASYWQSADPKILKEAQMYLFGQAATMTDVHVLIYFCLSAIVILFIAIFYRPLQAVHFDCDFAKAAAIGPAYLSAALSILLIISIVAGIRSVGVILMSGMLIAPAVAARQWTDRLGWLFFLSALFGILSGVCGNILSVEGSIYLSAAYPDKRLSLPTGPMIILVGTAFAILSLLFAPRRGHLARKIRIFRFYLNCAEENTLKAIWKKGGLSFSELHEVSRIFAPLFRYLLFRMERDGYLVRMGKNYCLSLDGMKRAARIVRLHRLWEVYLADLGWPGDQVHRTAEEMEHILTRDLEEKLSKQLNDPKLDPHEQPIPEKS